MYINFLCIPQAFSVTVFLLIVFSINFKISAPLPPEVSKNSPKFILKSVLKMHLPEKLCTTNAAGVVGDVTEKFILFLVQLSSENRPFKISNQLHQPLIFYSILGAQSFEIIYFFQI